VRILIWSGFHLPDQIENDARRSWKREAVARLFNPLRGQPPAWVWRAKRTLNNSFHTRCERTLPAFGGSSGVFWVYNGALLPHGLVRARCAAQIIHHLHLPSVTFGSQRRTHKKETRARESASVPQTDGCSLEMTTPTMHCKTGDYSGQADHPLCSSNLWV
jgi:hypothetical protein